MPFLIGITGGSCSGKTTIARSLTHALGAGAVLIAEDDYYICASTIANFDAAARNYDEPAAKDHALLLDHLRAARAGQSFEKPLYDFETHMRKRDVERVTPGDFVIAEGMHILSSPDLRALFDLTIFMDTGEAHRKDRRLRRDMEERGRSADSILEQFRTHVQPMHELHVTPQSAYADLVLTFDSARKLDDYVADILPHIFQTDK